MYEIITKHKKIILITSSIFIIVGLMLIIFNSQDRLSNADLNIINHFDSEELSTQNTSSSTLQVTESVGSKSLIQSQYTSDNSLVANILLQRNILKLEPIYRIANLDLVAQDILFAYNQTNSMPDEEKITLILDTNNLKSNGWKAVVVDNLNSGMLSEDEQYKFLLSDEYLYFGIYNFNNRFSIVAMNLKSPSKPTSPNSDNESESSYQSYSNNIVTELPELTFDIDDFYEKLNSIGSNRTSPTFDIEDYIPKSYECYYVAVPYGAGLEKKCD